MTARHENDNAACALASELAAGLTAAERKALGEFLSDLSLRVRWL